MNVSIVSTEVFKKAEMVAADYTGCPKLLGKEAAQIGLVFCDRLLERLQKLTLEVEELAKAEAENPIFNDYDQLCFRSLERKLEDAETLIQAERRRLKARNAEIQKPGHIIPAVDQAERVRIKTEIPF